ncbi:hypothetical protein BC833DRAFT_586505 [Globomyces pollinis-pini]|nr:hypothetical protein BC833DRAFT_586505 [Globomyces pollinis-pini]
MAFLLNPNIITVRRKAFLLAAIAFFLFVIPFSCWLNYSSSLRKNEETIIVGEVVSKSLASLLISMNFFSYPTLSSTARFQITKDESIPNFSFNTITKNYNITNAKTFVDQTYTVFQGTPIAYPWDTYFFAVTFDVMGTGLTKDNIHIEIISDIDGWQISTFEIEGPIISSSSGKVTVTVPVEVSRSIVYKLFAMFIFLIMWFLSLSSIAMAISIWLSGRTVEPPTIGIQGALLFALPAIRNSQPSVPSIGITFDIAGFFFNELLIAISMVILMWNYITKHSVGVILQPVESKPQEKPSEIEAQVTEAFLPH